MQLAICQKDNAVLCRLVWQSRCRGAVLQVQMNHTFFPVFWADPASCGFSFIYVVGSIIAGLGSKRLAYNNLLPFAGKPLVGLGVEILREAKLVDEIVVPTESELIAGVRWVSGRRFCGGRCRFGGRRSGLLFR